MVYDFRGVGEEVVCDCEVDEGEGADEGWGVDEGHCCWLMGSWSMGGRSCGGRGEVVCGERGEVLCGEREGVRGYCEEVESERWDV